MRADVAGSASNENFRHYVVLSFRLVLLNVLYNDIRSFLKNSVVEAIYIIALIIIGINSDNSVLIKCLKNKYDIGMTQAASNGRSVFESIFLMLNLNTIFTKLRFIIICNIIDTHLA